MITPSPRSSDSSAGGASTTTKVLAVMVAVLSVAVLVLVVVVAIRPSQAQPAAAAGEGQLLAAASEKQGQHWTLDDPDALTAFVENSSGSQLTYYNTDTGEHIGTASERFSRPALSLAKLYIADYVLEHGTEAERFEVAEMIASSNDETASQLYDAYPEAIEATAEKYGLLSTRSGEQWGYSMTSTYDVVSFLSQLMEEDPESPILIAMALADPVAADGYPQDYGTAVLPGVEGTKWGWSDDHELNSSVSFGDGYIVAAAVTGSADDLTELVEFQLGDLVGEQGGDD